MDPVQFRVLVDSINRMTEALRVEPYTLTGASDWNMLVVMVLAGASLVGVLFSIIVYNIKDLKSYIKESDSGVRILLDKEEVERKHQDDLLWNKTRDMELASKSEHAELKLDMIRCKEKCCEGV